MNLSIIIPVRDDADGLEACLQSIQSAEAGGVIYEVVVVDNGSSDQSVEVARSHGAKVIIEPDATVAALRNLGAQESIGDVLAFLDSDCTVSGNWFLCIEKHLSDKAMICFGSPPGIPHDANWVQRCWYQIRRKDNNKNEVFGIEWLESMNLFVRREVFHQVDGFDEDMTTCEDYDLCVRIAAISSVVCDNRIVAVHHGEAKTLKHFYNKERWRGTSNFYGLSKHGFDLSELPSVALPAVQVCAVVLAFIALLLCVVGAFPVHVWLLGLVIWQLPLLLLSIRKGRHPFQMQQILGTYLLLNVYFLARGISLFSAASWSQRKANEANLHVVL